MSNNKTNKNKKRTTFFIKSKRIIYFIVIISVLFIGLVYYTFCTQQTKFADPYKFLYIPSAITFKQQHIMYMLDTGHMVSNHKLFEFYASKFSLWNSIKPGRYEIKKGMSIRDIINKLKYGSQSPVSLVLKKIRTKEQLASLCGNYLEGDSTLFAEYFSSTDLQAENNFNEYTFMSYMIPNTYFIYWNTNPEQFIKRMLEEHKKFWNLNRLQKAALLKLTPLEVYTLASIVEEETLKNDEKQVIASVYLNRLQYGMKLEADPTVKFCTKDFNLKRIRFKHVDQQNQCLYNTYHFKGLPPGPICTPSVHTLDAVLQPASSKYLYFCARPERDGYHSFSENYSGHLENARKFHRMLNENKIR